MTDNFNKENQRNECDFNPCPDLTHLWCDAILEKDYHKISEKQMKEIHNALNVLEKHGHCQLKFGL